MDAAIADARAASGQRRVSLLVRGACDSRELSAASVAGENH
jgi:hypothetical protein